MTAIALMILTALLAPVALAGSIILAAIFGVIEPIEFTEKGKLWRIGSHRPISTRQTHSASAFSTGLLVMSSNDRRALVTTVMVTVVAAQLILNEPQPLTPSVQVRLGTEGATSGKFVAANA